MKGDRYCPCSCHFQYHLPLEYRLVSFRSKPSMIQRIDVHRLLLLAWQSLAHLCWTSLKAATAFTRRHNPQISSFLSDRSSLAQAVPVILLLQWLTLQCLES